MTSQRKPSSPLFQSISKPFERSPAWVRVLSWCILGVITAVLVATLISCPILLLLRLLSPNNFPAGLSQGQANSGDSTLTPALISHRPRRLGRLGGVHRHHHRWKVQRPIRPCLLSLRQRVLPPFCRQPAQLVAAANPRRLRPRRQSPTMPRPIRLRPLRLSQATPLRAAQKCRHPRPPGQLRMAHQPVQPPPAQPPPTVQPLC